MADGRPIVFGPGDKLAWLEEVASHPETKAIDAAVSIKITQRVDKYLGTATVSQGWIASEIHCTERTTRSSVKRMQLLFLLSVMPSRGRGLANVYTPILQRKNRQPASAFVSENRKGVSAFTSENRKISVVKPENFGRKTGKDFPPLPNKNHSSSSDDIDHGSLPTDRWQALKGRLADRLGPDIVQAWFSKLWIDSETETEITLGAPSTFHRDRVSANWLDDIVSAHRACDPDSHITRARIVHRDRSRELKAAAQ